MGGGDLVRRRRPRSFPSGGPRITAEALRPSSGLTSSSQAPAAAWRRHGDKQEEQAGGSPRTLLGGQPPPHASSPGGQGGLGGRTRRPWEHNMGQVDPWAAAWPRPPGASVPLATPTHYGISSPSVAFLTRATPCPLWH